MLPRNERIVVERRRNPRIYIGQQEVRESRTRWIWPTVIVVVALIALAIFH